MPSAMSPETSEPLKLNPLLRIQFDEPVLCELLLENKTLELPDVRYVELLGQLGEPRSASEAARLASQTLGVTDEGGAAIIEDLRTNGVLVPASREHPLAPAIQHWIDRGWLEGLLLHLKTRNVEYLDDNQEAQQEIAAQMAEQIRQEGLPEFWKRYEGKPETALPAPGALPGGQSLQDVLLRRRSNEGASEASIPLDTLSTLLHHANIELVRLRSSAEQSVAADPTVLLRSAYSALETYVVVHAVEGLAPGIYHYDPKRHLLVQLKTGTFRQEVRTIAAGQPRAAQGAVTLMITAVWKRYMFRYRYPRAFRTLLTNVAELGQKYLLLATAFRFAMFFSPNLIFKDADALLGLNNYEEGTLYEISIGQQLSPERSDGRK